MRALVCGGRDFRDRAAVWRQLDALNPGSVLEGGATGADQFAREWATERGRERITVQADWNAFGKSAGPRRNDAMLAYKPDVVLAFPGGRGTADMVARAKKAGVQVIELNAEAP